MRKESFWTLSARSVGFAIRLLLVTAILAACTSEDSELLQQRTMTMRLVGGVMPFDADSATTRAAQWTWPNGAVLYLQLYNGSNRMNTTATYSQGTGEWTVISPTGTLAASGKCEAYYFDGTTGGTANVTLGATVGVYGDSNGTYTLSDDNLTISTKLSPLTSRLQFVSPTSTAVNSITVEGITVNTAYDAANNKFTTSADAISSSVNSSTGHTDYIYGTFTDTSARQLKVTNSTDGSTVNFTRSFGSNVLQTGKSGQLTIPTKNDVKGWTMQDNTLPADENALTITVDGVSFNMIFVEAGTFQMGSEDSEAYGDEKPVHSVTFTNDYYIGQTEVTQALWFAVMGQKPTNDGPQWSNEFGLGDNHPAYFVSWNDCQEFITKLNTLTGKTFRLPTEAEWEFAARGGNKSKGYKYAGSNTVDDVVWYGGNSNSTTHDVATKQANELGIYDMNGNAYEWCYDWFDKNYYSSSPSTEPTGPTTGSARVLRGGCWKDGNARDCRVSNRYYWNADDRSEYPGFRLVLPTATETPSGNAPAGVEAVDLGLPSGTKWANMNVGAEKPEEYGDYFAWGETTPKAIYNWSTYKYCNKSETTMTKYCTQSEYGSIDNKTVLDSEDDAAVVNWGGDWSMPTYEEYQELLDNCTSEWITVGSVSGYKFTSSVNGNSIFFPAAGYRDGGSLDSVGSGGGYWSASLGTSGSYSGRYLYFYSGNVGTNYSRRYNGRSVRAVLRN